jgi:hypothetical protein
LVFITKIINKVTEIEEKIDEILLANFQEGDWQTARKQLLNIFSIMPRSYGIVRWYDNKQEVVVCVNKATAEEYVKKYNELAGDEKCYVDEDIWLPLNEA